MSEEILNAIIQLFAIMVKGSEGVQDDIKDKVRSFLKSQLSSKDIERYYFLFEEHIQSNSFSQNFEGNVEGKNKKLSKRRALIERLKEKDAARKQAKGKRDSMVSVTDSVTTLFIAKKINKTLSHRQKIIVLIRLLELMKFDQAIWENRLEMAETVSSAFNVDRFEFDELQSYVFYDHPEEFISQNILIANAKQVGLLKYLECEHIDQPIIILKVNSCDLVFMKYLGEEELIINGVTAPSNQIHVLTLGSTVKTASSHSIYYSDINAKFLNVVATDKVHLQVKDLHHKFQTGKTALFDINFEVNEGQMVGIMGGSGSGKTTLINVLSGVEKATSGQVLINGFDLHNDRVALEGVLGFIPQDDVLVEDLTVRENLYYASKLSIPNKSEEELYEQVDSVLRKVGLFDVRDLFVGSVVNKMISGGQRKRLNIALELIREPKVLFVDEPTSGLSSRDSEIIMDLLRDLSLKGKLIITVIHQPSSLIFKMFDKLFLLDEGGVPVFFGNPLEAIPFFQSYDNDVNRAESSCLSCGNIEPESLFKILEAKVVDEYGEFTAQRKVAPVVWKDRFERHNLSEVKPVSRIESAQAHPKPGLFAQFKTFLSRELKSKLANKQYLVITLIEGPLLAVILGGLVKQYRNFGDDYSYGDNLNIPAYLFIATIVALFMGLSVSAEEIVKDQKIRRREQFLHLSKFSYLSSKVLVLMIISLIQTWLFTIIGNYILEVPSFNVKMWVMLFSASCFANILGLNISSSFRNAVSVYILIPLLLIPQMVLSGAMFSFDRLNKYVGHIDHVPVVADLMASRWAFEGLCVELFTKNEHTKQLFRLEQEESIADFNQVYRLPHLRNLVEEILVNVGGDNPVLMGRLIEDVKKQSSIDLAGVSYQEYEKHIGVISNNDSLQDAAGFLSMYTVETFKANKDGIRQSLSILSKELIKDGIKEIQGKVEMFSWNDLEYLVNVLDSLEEKSRVDFLAANNALHDQKYELQRRFEDFDAYNEFKKSQVNNRLETIVKRKGLGTRIVEYDGELIQRIDPIYRKPSFLRNHFFVADKYLLGNLVSTYNFNIAVLWLLSFIAFITLYFNVMPNFVNYIMKLVKGVLSIKS